MKFREVIGLMICGAEFRQKVFHLVEKSQKVADRSLDLRDRLARIAAQEKETSNATVRCMTRIARGEE